MPLSATSPAVLPSPYFGRVGVHDFPFEACSGFTHVTARRFARPPKGSLCRRASIQPVTQLNRLPATGPTDHCPGGTFTHKVIAPFGDAPNHADSDRLNDLSRRVSGCAFTVLNTLGAGFLEKVYENALALELRAAGLAVAQQHAVSVHYNGAVVGEYFADLLVEDVLLVELKTVKALDDAHRIECSFRFANFREALAFVQQVGELAEAQCHHPDVHFGWGYATVSLQTKKIKGLHENDFIMAAKIDRLVQKPNG